MKLPVALHSIELAFSLFFLFLCFHDNLFSAARSYNSQYSLDFTGYR